jgi:hypothetical protein
VQGFRSSKLQPIHVPFLEMEDSQKGHRDDPAPQAPRLLEQKQPHIIPSAKFPGQEW